MAEQTLMTISYKRVKSSEEVTLTQENCQKYGYGYRTKNINGQSVIVFYDLEDSENDLEYQEIVDGVAKTVIVYNDYQEYSHIAPACTSYQFSYADVDKDGSGRNTLTGEMFRERLGNYCMLDVKWDLIPNTTEYHNWYKILTSLPPKVSITFLNPNGEMLTKEFYRTDVSTSLYLFVKEKQIWQGLSTTFVQWNVDEYDDTIEPQLQGD